MAARTRSRFDRDDDTGPRSDVYTGLLALSLIAMIVSSLLLFLDYSQYTGAVPKVAIPSPKLKEGVQTGQLPPALLLPPPAAISPRPFTRGTETVAGPPVMPVGGEESLAPTAPAPIPDPPPAQVTDPAPAPVADPAPVPPPQPEPVTPAPTPEPVVAPPTPAPPAPTAPGAPLPPPLPKSIRNLPN
jgi:hypothetical protein